MGLRISRRTGVMHWEAQRARTRQAAPPARQNRGNDGIDYSAITRFMKPNYALRMLAFVGTVMGLGAVGGMVGTQQAQIGFENRPRIRIAEPIQVDDHTFLMNVRILNTTYLETGMRMEPVDKCGVRIRGKELLEDNLVQFRVDASGVVDTCSVRIKVGRSTFLVRDAFFR